MKAIIIEDEKRAAKGLQMLLAEVDSSIEIIAFLQTIDQSVKWLSTNPQPNVIFMDIHLADGSAFGIFEQVSIECPIIFTTAYDEYALQAFRVNSIDYLLKPINKEDLERALHKIKLMGGKNTETEQSALLNNLLKSIRRESPVYKTSYLIAHKDKLIPIATSQFAYIFTENKIVKAVLADGKSHVVNHTLDELEAQLNPNSFFRINRQYIINRQFIKDCSVWFEGRLAVNLTVPVAEKIFVSRQHVKDFKQWVTES